MLNETKTNNRFKFWILKMIIKLIELYAKFF